MSEDIAGMRKDIETKREDVAKTALEIGNRVAVPKTTFIVGMITGIMLLAILNRVQFRRPKK